MEEAGKKMEAAEKSGDPNKQMEAAMGVLGTAISGGKGDEPLPVDAVKPFLPETFAGLPRSDRSERSGLAAKAEADLRRRDGKKTVHLQVTDTGGAAGLLGLAAWVGALRARRRTTTASRARARKAPAWCTSAWRSARRPQRATP